MPNYTTTFTDPNRILNRLDERSIEGPGGCLIWIGALDKYGYGRISTIHGTMYTHKARWIALNGPLPSPDHRVRHTCGNKSCSNPDHLKLFPEVVTEVTD